MELNTALVRIKMITLLDSLSRQLNVFIFYLSISNMYTKQIKIIKKSMHKIS